MIFDLHVHTVLSACGRMEIQDILARARDCGLEGVCITDHATMAIRHVLPEGVQDNGVCVIFGMEYSTCQGDFLLFGPFEEIQPNLCADLLLRTVHNSGGVAVAAHPFRKGRPVDERLIRDGLCRVVESINGRNTPMENSAVQRWRLRYDITECGGSDAHTLDELGTAATRLFMPVRTRMELIQALKHRLCRTETPFALYAAAAEAVGPAVHPDAPSIHSKP